MQKRRKIQPHNVRLYHQIKRRVRRTGRDFSILPEDIVIPQFCPILGVELDITDPERAPSIDRIDNSKGYIPGNIAVISHRANRMKSDNTLETLQRLLMYVSHELPDPIAWGEHGRFTPKKSQHSRRAEDMTEEERSRFREWGRLGAEASRRSK
jgi:predicted SprT family Zn-dependent metalloprotease